MDTKTIYTEKWSLQIVLWWESHSQTILLEISPVNFINYDVPSHFFPFFYPFDNIVVFAVQTSWSIINAMWIYNSFRFCFRVLKKTFGFGVFAHRCILVLLMLPTLDERLEKYLNSILSIYLTTNQCGAKVGDWKNYSWTQFYWKFCNLGHQLQTSDRKE